MFRLTLATRLALSMFLLAGWTATTGAADNAQLTQREDPYFLQAQAQLQQRLKQTPNTNRAKTSFWWSATVWVFHRDRRSHF